MSTIRIALAQINPTVGDFAGNAAKIIANIEQARQAGADIVAVPELALTGYPPEDLLLKPQFIAANRKALDEVIVASTGIVSIIGFVDRTTDIHNAAAVVCDGELKGVYHKTFLPNYSVFDEYRYFDAGQSAPIFAYGEVLLGVNICEDIWYPGGPTQMQALAGAQIIINISASPYHAGKGKARERMLATRAEDNAVALAYVNLIGGQDELVFDGQSLVIDERGQIVARGKVFEEDLLIADINTERVFKERLHDPRRRQERIEVISGVNSIERIPLRAEAFSVNRSKLPVIQEEPRPALTDEVYRALVVATRDYVLKNGFKSVVIGSSGGIDSALTACVAVDALGAENVTCVFMPTRFSAGESARDAEQLAKNLNVAYHVVPIEETFNQYLKMLQPVFDGTPMGVAEENIQARVRGNILMAMSNKFGAMVLTTGNKSEVSVGYCTLYGDMCGGYAVIKDVPKMLVYELSRYVNRRDGRETIPDYIITRPPSAELREDQKDTDSLPPYEVLDEILDLYVEEDWSIEAIISEKAGVVGFDEATVRRIARLVDLNEYKRRQAAPGVRITPRAFGRDRRMPITNKFRG
ncbi:MAG TPA: NAD+ synthase [Blastocatellia bacterium]|nr:NAD+ synthase [Blastocatellia bacterium]HMV84854.1 NAD+ synthase [Blastocatellia bacterium]HMX26294.1 NAD+ synthase [Blastocatellia bacterium]HMY73158.1 NAD+ synthase [Blastocatellia bacterium]HMZ22339.1 NAD+ synthase [Blastocatellia bacterium]